MRSNSNNIVHYKRKHEKDIDIWEVVFGDGIVDCFSVMDKAQTIVKANGAFERAFGQGEEVIGRKCYEVVHGASLPPVDCPHLEAMRNRTSVIKELFDERLETNLLVTIAPIIDNSNQFVGSMHIIQGLFDTMIKRPGGEAESEEKKSEVALTERQLQVLQLLCEGRSAKEIAFRLKLSTRTVEFHKYSLIRKLHTGTLAGLIRYAVANRYVI